LEFRPKLRRAGIIKPIQVLGGIPIVSIDKALKFNFTLSLGDLEFAKAVAKKAKAAVGVHVKVDTGLGRFGIKHQDFLQTLVEIQKLQNLKIEGIFTHFADSTNDPVFTRKQGELFLKIRKQVLKDFQINPIFHACNSGGILNFPEYHLDMVRSGILTYGAIQPNNVGVAPALTLKSRISQIKNILPGESVGYSRTFIAEKKMKTALIMIGYADGIHISASNKGFILIGGHKCKITGRVSMDQLSVDVTKIPEPKINDEVVLIGKQGSEEITVSDWANWSGTNDYEILTSISSRVPRIHI